MRNLKKFMLLFCIVGATFCWGLLIYVLSFKNESNPYQKGQHFDLRGGSVVIENNEKDSVVWFKNDSTYFYETYKTLGIDGQGN